MKTEILLKNGVRYIAADGKILDTLAFKSFRPTQNNISDFYKAGVRIFHVYCSGLSSALGIPYSMYGETWFGDADYRFENLDRQIEFFRETAPDAYVFVNVHLDTREWWLKNNPGRPNSFTHLSQIAADEKWKQDTAEYLKALIQHVEEKYDEVVLGYFLLGGYTTEWFSNNDFEASHPIKLAAYREYMQDQKAVIPEKSQLEKEQSQIFLDPAADKNIISYRKFHNKIIADLVLYFCHEAQAVLKHKKVLGVFYGYIMELTNEGLWNRGHLDNDRVYRSPDIDLFATPSSYQFRGYDDATAYMLLSDTLDLNGKMYFDSFDHMTFTVPTLTDHPRRLSDKEDGIKGLTDLCAKRSDRLTTREHTIHCMRREFMQRLSRRTGMWWFDMLEGWYYDDGLMEEVGITVQKSQALLDTPRASSSEIAVFVSCESMYYVNKCSEMNTELICTQRDALARIGAPHDLYSLNDLEKINTGNYKFYVFLNAFSLSDCQRDYINRTLKNENRTILFIGFPDYIGDNDISLERVCSITEMKIETLEAAENRVNAFKSVYGYTHAKHPTLSINDPTALPLGFYESSGKCALAKKEKGNCTVYYSTLGNLSHSALREMARSAGVHIYAEEGTAVYVNSAFAGVYKTGGKKTVLTLKADGSYREIFSGKIYRTENKKVTLPTDESPAQMLILTEQDAGKF